jgi:hypothetical protein
MEDIVYPPMRRQFDVVDTWANNLCDSERSKAFGVQFGGWVQ